MGNPKLNEPDPLYEPEIFTGLTSIIERPAESRLLTILLDVAVKFIPALRKKRERTL
jgi:hypothetical protein